MDKINWKQKLTSRKFWAALLAVAASLMTVWHTGAETREAILGLGWAVAALIAYIVGEGLVDAARERGSGEAEKAGSSKAEEKQKGDAE